MTSIPPEDETSIEGVGKYIAAHEHDPALRVKALHDYVANRAAYDGPAYRAGNIPIEDGDAQKTFERRLGVCAGYAQLLAALGKASGDEIVYLIGICAPRIAPSTARRMRGTPRRSTARGSSSIPRSMPATSTARRSTNSTRATTSSRRPTSSASHTSPTTRRGSFTTNRSRAATSSASR